MERGYWPWRPYAPYWRNTRPDDGRRGNYNYPNARAPQQVRLLAGGPLRQLDNRFPPPAFGHGPQPERRLTRRTRGVARGRQASSRARPGYDHAADGASSSTSTAGRANGRDSYATHSVCYVSDGQKRQVELKVPLLKIPKLFQHPPDAKESIHKMAVSEPPGHGPDNADAVPSKAENACAATEKPKASKASVPTSSKAPKAGSSKAVTSEGERAVLKKTTTPATTVPKPVSVKESQISELKSPQAIEKAVSKPLSRVSNDEENPSHVGARKTGHSATKSQKLVAPSADSSKPIPESESSESPSQVSNAKVNPPSALAEKTNHAAIKPKKLGTSSVLSSKLVAEAEKSKATSSRASEETAVLKPPENACKANASPSNVAARETDRAAKPIASSVTGSKPILVKVLQTQGKPVPPQASKMVSPDQAKTVRAPAASMKAKASSVAALKPIPVRESQASEAALPQASIPVLISRGVIQPHSASFAHRKSASSHKQHSPSDEFFEDVSDVSLEEYCDDPNYEASQGVMFGAGREEPQQPSCDKEKATSLSDCEDVSDTPLTMYHSPQKSGNTVQPARQLAGEGVAKGPVGKKKVIGHTAPVKKGEEQKCMKGVEACHSQRQTAAKPKLVATNKAKAHLGPNQDAAKLTAPPSSKPGGAGSGAVKRQLEWPGAPHDLKKRKTDTSSEKSKPDPCVSCSTEQNGSPLTSKKLVVKSTNKAVSCTTVSTKPSAASSNNEESSNVSSTMKKPPMVAPSTTQRNGSSLPAKKMAAKKTEKEASCSKISTKPSMATLNNKKETSRDSPVAAPKLESSKEIVAKNKKPEPATTKTQSKADTGHSSVVTPAHKKDPEKRKPTPPKKAPMMKSAKSVSPGKAAKLSKTPPACTFTKAKGRTNCLAPSCLPMKEGSPNPQAQTEVAPAEKQPQPPSRKGTVKVHTPGSEGTSTKACKSSGISAAPVKHQDTSKVPETLLWKDDATEKGDCSSSTENAPECVSSSDVRPGSSLKHFHASKITKLSLEATKANKSFNGHASVPKELETEAKGTLCSATDGQPRDDASQKPTGSIKEQKTTQVESQGLGVPKGSPSYDTLQTFGSQIKTQSAMTVKVSGIEGDMKNSDAAEQIEDRCVSPSASAPEQEQSTGDLSKSGCAMKTNHPASKIVDQAAKATAGKEVLRKLTSGDIVKGKHPASKMVNKDVKATVDNKVLSTLNSEDAGTQHHVSKIVGKAAEATTDEDKPTCGSVVKTQHPESEIADSTAEHTTDNEIVSTVLNNVTCSSLSQEPQSMNVLLSTGENSTLSSEEKIVEGQAEGLAGSKTAATSPRDEESLKQAQVANMVSLPSCNVKEEIVETDTNVPAVREENISGSMLPHGGNSQKSPADDAPFANGNCESLGTNKGISLLTSQKWARDTLSLAQRSDDKGASVNDQVSSSEQPRKKSPIPQEPPDSAETTKQGNSESPSACDHVAPQEVVEDTDSSRKPPPGEDTDKGHPSTASTESCGQTDEESGPSPPHKREGDCPMTALRGTSGEQDASATLGEGGASACKLDADAEKLATLIHQKVVKPSPLKKKNKNKGPGTNTSMRSAWLFSRKKRGKRRRSSTGTSSGSSPKKLKRSSGSSETTDEHSTSPTVVKKKPVDNIDTEAALPPAATPGRCSGTKPASCPPGQARRSRDSKSTGSSAKKFKAAVPSQNTDPQCSSSKFTGEPSTRLVKKEPGVDVDTEAQVLLNAPGTLRICRVRGSPAVQASDRSPKPACWAKSPAANRKLSDPSSSSSGTASAAMPESPLEIAMMDLDMFTGLSILDVCGSAAGMLAELKEQLRVHSITQGAALNVVQKAVHKAVLDEYFKREQAIRTLKLLAKIPFTLDHAKVAKIRQLTCAILGTSPAGSKP